jgi:hypothetical protein
MKKYVVLITTLLPIIASAQIVMTGSYYMVMAGGTQANPTSLVLTNSAPTALTNNGSGWIVSENEFNQVDWPIGTNTGNYMVPFGYSNTDYLPVTCNVATSGIGNGSIKFATYHCATWDNFTYKPSDVLNMKFFSDPDFSKGDVDRFWILDANGYTTKPTLSNISFNYIHSGTGVEVAAPNYISEANLIANRYNSTLNEWYDWLGASSTESIIGNVGNVQSGPVSPSNFYRSWTLFEDSATTTGSPAMSNITSGNNVNIYPNPGNGNFTVAGVTQGQVIELYNYLGQLLATKIADASTVRFDISTKANGVYLMRIQDRDGSNVTEKKIVKTQ